MKGEPNDKILILAGSLTIVNKWRVDFGLSTDEFSMKYLIAYDIDSVRGRRFSGFIKLPNWYSIRNIEKIIEYLEYWQVPEEQAEQSLQFSPTITHTIYETDIQ